MKSLEVLIEGKWEDKVVISNNINYKTQLMAYGGMGYSNLFENTIPLIEERYGDIIKKLTLTNITRLLAWWKKKEKEKVKLKTWKCQWCKKEYEEDKDGFSKNDFLYCSMPCLQAHTKANFK